jgi:hypothetical protein
MPKHCAAFDCHGNYKGQPYTRMVRFPTEENERRRWIEAIPSNPLTLNRRRDIYVCASHFYCFWTAAKGGLRPVGPPTVFRGIAKSCIKQTFSGRRRTTEAFAFLARQKQQEIAKIYRDKMNSCDKFTRNVAEHFPEYIIRRNGDEVSMVKLSKSGNKVIQFVLLRKITSHFAFLLIVRLEKDGYEVPKNVLNFQKAVR